MLILTASGRAFSFSLTFSQADILSKGYYTSELFYISGVCFPKLSILVLFFNIVASRQFLRRMVLALGIFISTWTLVALVTIAFQCELPRPWKTTSSHCLNFVSGSSKQPCLYNTNTDSRSGFSGLSIVHSTY